MNIYKQYPSRNKTHTYTWDEVQLAGRMIPLYPSRWVLGSDHDVVVAERDNLKAQLAEATRAREIARKRALCERADAEHWHTCYLALAAQTQGNQQEINSLRRELLEVLQRHTWKPWPESPEPGKYIVSWTDRDVFEVVEVNRKGELLDFAGDVIRDRSRPQKYMPCPQP